MSGRHFERSTSTAQGENHSFMINILPIEAQELIDLIKVELASK